VVLLVVVVPSGGSARHLVLLCSMLWLSPLSGARACFVVLAADAEGKRKLIGGDAFTARSLGPLPG